MNQKLKGFLPYCSVVQYRAVFGFFACKRHWKFPLDNSGFDFQSDKIEVRLVSFAIKVTRIELYYPEMKKNYDIYVNM